MAIYNGTPGDDMFPGTTSSDTANGNGGNDFLSGEAGEDSLAGGAGADTLDGGASQDTLYSADPTANLYGPVFNRDLPWIQPLLDTGAEVDTLYGGAGADILFAGYGDAVYGGNDFEADTLYVSFQAAPSGVTADFRQASMVIGGGVINGIEELGWVQGSEFADTLTAPGNNGHGGHSVMQGMGGDDHLIAGYYTYSQLGGTGDDVLDAREGGALIDGEAGNDVIYTSGARSYGGEGDDLIQISHGYNTVAYGGDGADIINGSENADVISAGLYFNNGTGYPAWDTGAWHDQLNGFDGDDFISIGYGDDADGGDGRDKLWLTFDGATSGVTFDTAGLVSGQPYSLGGGTIQNVEILDALQGSRFSDVLTIAVQPQLGVYDRVFVDGAAGDDTVIASAGRVDVTGGAGDDRFVSGSTNNWFNGGDGNDTIDFSAASAGVSITVGSMVTGYVTGGSGGTFQSVENVTGSNFDDVLAGTTFANRFDGGAGLDTVSYAQTYGGSVNVSLAISGAQDTGGGGVDTLVNIENLIGSISNDILIGNSGDNVLDGGAGTDTVSYEAASSGVIVSLAFTGGQNTVGAGLDTLIGFENLTGSAFNDVLSGDSGGNILTGGAGDDQLDGGGGNDTAGYASATSGVQVRLGAVGAQDTGGAGTDTLASIENLAGSAFNDTLTGDSGANIIAGASGDDLIEGGAGNDALDGGAGRDTVSYASTAAAVTVSLATTTAQDTLGAGVDTLTGFESLSGSAFGDTLTGDGGSNSLSGLAGDDLLSGGGGNDILDGGIGTDTATYASATSFVTLSLELTAAQNTRGAGTDTLVSIENLIGSAFDDTLIGDAGSNVLNGLAGNDTLNAGLGDDTLHGGAGNDTALYSVATSGVSVSLAVTTAQNTIGAGNDTLISIENLGGSPFADTLTGDGGSNVISGAAGDDLIDGGSGADTLDGGTGIDTVSYASATSFVQVNLARTTAQATIGGGTDTLSGFENLTGSNFNDTLTGNGGANVIFGAGGDDAIDGGAGNDTLDGGSGVDTASYQFATAGVTVNLALTAAQNTGGAGSDTLSGFENLVGSAFDDVLTGDDGGNVLFGGAGDDTLNGGAGVDIAAFVNPSSQYAIAYDGTTVTVTGPDGIDTLRNIEQLAFTDGAIVVAERFVLGTSGADTLVGTSGKNILSGFEGDDLLEGLDGDDTLNGGAGIDTATFAHATAGVTVSLAINGPVLTFGAGADTLISIENVIGSDFDDWLGGNAGANVLVGGAGDDTLDGWGGNDALDGGAGQDVALFSGARSSYIVQSNGATVTVSEAGGTSTLSNIERLQFSDQTLLVANLIPSGGSGSDALTGTTGDDTLDGGAGDDTLNGGLGNDLLYGGSGNDTYMVGSQGDLTFEDAGGGTDTVVASVDIYLYPNIENLTLAAGAGSIFGVGNGGDNSITGNEGDNLLIAGGGNDTASGGAGADRLFGEDGNDTLNGDAGTDYLVAGTGDDAVYGGAGADSLYGEDGNDTLYGGSDNAVDLMVAGVGDDSLHGDSGQGEGDLMDGGSGNDTYYVDAAGDLTFEAANGGTDLVIADIAGGGYYLWAHTENLTLAGTTLYGVGNELDNVLTGNAGVNWLLGRAGNDTLNGKAGNDVLFGEAGSDTFVFERGTGGDVIGDFQAGTDKIKLTGLGFADFAAVKANMHQVGADTAIDLGQGELVVILGVGVNAFAAGDFVLN